MVKLNFQKSVMTSSVTPSLLRHRKMSPD